MNNYDVCRGFVGDHDNNCRDGCGGHNSSHSLYYENRVLYSYGSHYPLAIKLSHDQYLINCSGYSITTSHHTSNLWSAIRDHQAYQAPTMAMKSWVNGDYKSFVESCIEHYQDEASNWSEKKLKARRADTREEYKKAEIEALQEAAKAQELVKLYGGKASTSGDWLKTISMVAKMGEVLADNNLKAKNDWKARMLKAGLENQGLIMPDDWDELSEEEKSRRLDGAISELVG